MGVNIFSKRNAMFTTILQYFHNISYLSLPSHKTKLKIIWLGKEKKSNEIQNKIKRLRKQNKKSNEIQNTSIFRWWGKERGLEKKESNSHTLEAKGRGRGRGTQFILPAIAHHRFSIFLKTVKPTSLYLS